MARFRATSYQTVVGAENSTGVLAYDPQQVGAGVDTKAGMVTDATSDYAYTPEADFQGAPRTSNFSSRGRGRIGRSPWVYEMPKPVIEPSLGGVGNRSNFGMTGAPNNTVQDQQVHGPWDGSGSIGDIPMTPLPQRRRWFDKFIGKDSSKDSRIVQAMGRPTVDDSANESEATIGQNEFIVPDARRLFDTPGVAGLGTDERGMPYVGKAGRPVQDNRFMPFNVKVENTRRVEATNSPPFLPDRTRAGAADPHSARASQIPQWMFQRPFDQGISQHMSGLKGVVRNPLAGRPVNTSSETASDIGAVHMGQRGYRISTPAPGMSASGPMPNTMRQIPTPWDSDLYAADSDSVTRPRRFGHG